MIITSRANETIKSARVLHRAKERKESGLHLIEGDKLVFDAVLSDAKIVRIFCEEGFLPPEGFETVFVTRQVLESLCESTTPQHLCAIVKTPDCTPPQSYPEGLILCLDGLQDIGNVGTIIRTTDALGAAAVLIGLDTADAFSPKGVRASMGSCYHIPIYKGELASELKRLKAQGFFCLCGHLKGSEALPKTGKKVALVIGNEGNGVCAEVANECYLYRMRQQGRAESLNAAAFAAIMTDRLINGRTVADL
ncbi:MAG: RNA methyltransferase [Clostridia bacterium]|nr:RNA methyltransferase [Clostridia bacterium]